MNSSITDLLGRWKDGDRAVENQLANAIYPVLRQIASSQLRRNPGHLTLRPTALVSEAYERIADQKDIAWQNRRDGAASGIDRPCTPAVGDQAGQRNHLR